MKKTAILMFLYLLVPLGTTQAQLKVDFTQTGDPVQAGYLGYFADHEVAATFTAQTFAAFGTTVTVLPTWAAGATPQAMQMIDRGGNDGTDTPDLLRDWIGTDGRQPGDPMTLTLRGLPTGVYEWVSYHHDPEDQTGTFDVTVTDTSGSVKTTGLDISDTRAGAITKLADMTRFVTTITANGKDDVTFAFDITSPTSPVSGAFFVMNAFELTLLESDNAIVLAPASGATDVLRDGTVLSWLPSDQAVAHDVYLGTDHDDIDDGLTTSAVYMGRQDANSFDPGRLELGETYYWRVDEVASDGTIAKGDVWSFTVEPVAISLVTGQITATASSMNPGSEPEKTIDGSGLSADDEHSTALTDMWLSAPGAPEPAWIQYEFDKVYKFHELLVWNSNQSSEPFIGFGAKSVTVEYSTDGAAWEAVGDVEFAQATGTADYVYDTTVSLNGVAAKYIRLTVNSNWGGLVKQYGLSEVRFTVVPVTARQPSPASGATEVDPRSTLTWRAGREAASHNVYLGTDPNEVASGTTVAGATSEPSFDAGSLLELGQTYYWKVDEVNDSQAPAVWHGNVWDFTVQEYLVVDNFESYTNDSPKRVFQHWIDGMGFSEDEFFPKGHSGNGSGALVGYDPTVGDIMEKATVHGGAQSMPMVYDSSVASYSEAERTFEAPQDWTGHGIQALVLWFCGDPANTASQMYVKVNGKKVLYDGDADNLLRKPWHLWYIPLSQFTGVDLSKVTKLAIGFEGGQGTVFFDDIGLSAYDRQLVTPVKPDASNLQIHYAFEGNTNSSVGALHATAGGTPTYAPGQVGQAIKLNGATDYLTVEGSFDLPEYSAAMWFQVEGGTGARDLVSIYSGGSHGVLLEVTGTGALRFLHRVPLGTSGGTDIRSNSNYADGQWYHVGIVKSADAVTLYVNGEQAATVADSTQFGEVLPRLTISALRHDSLSRFFPGTIDEFYLYNRALSQAETAWLAGLMKPFDK